jgi:hypothetical protein
MVFFCWTGAGCRAVSAVLYPEMLYFWLVPVSDTIFAC